MSDFAELVFVLVVAGAILWRLDVYGYRERRRRFRQWQRAEFMRLTRFPVWWTTSSISREMGLKGPDPYLWVFIDELEDAGQLEIQFTPDTMTVPAYRGIPHGHL